MTDLPAPVPHIDEDGAEFWAATAEGRFLLQRCDSCGKPIWYPRSICPFCHRTALSFSEASGTGTIYSFSVTSRGGMDDYAGIDPYVLAYVELAEGPRMLTNIVDCDPDGLEIGQPVTVVFSDTGAGCALPRFRPA